MRHTPKPFVAFGPGFSGDYDSLEEALSVIENNKAGAVYRIISVDDPGGEGTFSHKPVANPFLGEAWEIARKVAAVDKQLLSMEAVRAFARLASLAQGRAAHRCAEIADQITSHSAASDSAYSTGQAIGSAIRLEFGQTPGIHRKRGSWWCCRAEFGEHEPSCPNSGSTEDHGDYGVEGMR